MSAAVVVDVVRTPIARRNGALAGWHPVDLVAEVLTGLQKRTAIDPAIVDDVIVGCVTQVGAQSSNIARNAVLAAGWPESVPGTTVDRQCGSSIQAVHFAAQGVLSGVYDIAVAAGVESMSVVPMFSNTTGNLGDPYGERIASRYGDIDTYGTRGIGPQGLSAERLAERYGLVREELDAFALSSHERAARAIAEGRFAAETWPVPARTRSDDDRVNVNGGAIALGHPPGATGVRLLATSAHELIRRRGRYGLMTVCEAGGMANATVVENLR